MIIVNPQDLTPMLSALKTELSQEMAQLSQSVQVSNDALSQSVAANNGLVITEIEALSVVNGEISTEVQAINAHTTNAVDTAKAAISQDVNLIPKSPIKNIYRGRIYNTSASTGLITIPVVNMSKTVVNLIASKSMYGSVTGDPVPNWMYLELINENTLKWDDDKYRSSAVTHFSWEVIEYA
ncbi:hypothetical protein [Vibrio vulnificus]|uniref:hypothetical protein n=1 Tax=Vibrio vulnificus TaxID=672 RepID=UPI0005FB5FC0|nr:hypothetical protein [Vibrio vulnificus]